MVQIAASMSSLFYDKVFTVIHKTEQLYIRLRAIIKLVFIASYFFQTKTHDANKQIM